MVAKRIVVLIILNDVFYMKMPRIAIFMVILVNIFTADAQNAGDTHTSSVLLNKASLEDVMAVLNAKPANEGDLIFVAMHNSDSDVKDLCFARISGIEKVQQARLICHILLDNTIILPIEDITNGWIARQQALRQISLRQSAYKLLGQTNNDSNVMSRAEIQSLVSELEKVR